MLVIRRRIGESLFIGNDVEVEVLGIFGNQIKIGINAPREILILRSEVRLTAEANRLAAQHASPALFASLAKKLQAAAHEPTIASDKDN